MGGEENYDGVQALAVFWRVRLVLPAFHFHIRIKLWRSAESPQP
jgi:hypothetical protein